jgi:uncharacterized membrane protein YidH (DUF202 family)
MDEEDIKEDFCGACIAAPLAIAGSGVIFYNSKNSSRKTYKLQKKISLWVAIILIIVSLGIAFYYSKTCEECKA